MRVLLTGMGGDEWFSGTDFALADLMDPGVTVVAQDPTAIGRAAAERVFARLEGDASPPRRLVLPTRLITRGSGEIRPRHRVPDEARRPR